MNRPPFGRRGASQPARTQASATSVARSERAAPAGIPADLNLSPSHSELSLDEELRAWKAQRSFTIPWKQFCLMASICFGIASFVLPDDVNRSVNWLLYGLTAMSFWVWFKGRRASAKT